ncbi:hypothetical protein Lesp02_51070 [Lentzea sp. NBRC 105346]|uniref:SAM-dependent methyltransferase n=1 Tax=Lentzea sp. NBRC 105346 TaxID=3032205 RepID=UPI0024A43F34|nr:SAM-dependent methyltransferase [Lentzea sp. NBRC 105346]GLZ32919.1 hypothetical protein Lesp02_51070 [Lentzea sp. NBRC 105346]
MLDWEEAWRSALYGPSGFFVRGERPSGHFRTAPLIGQELASALLSLLDRVDHALGRPPVVDFVDMGAGGGELSAAVRELASGSLSRRLRVTGVDLAPDPSLPGVRWTSSLEPSVGLLVAHEWLDAIPCPVVQGPSDDPWLARWWPLGEGEWAEVGAPRDAAWASAVASVTGAALAIDYGHTADCRRPTLTGYRDGRQVAPVFDGSCDITAHVAFDSAAAAAGGSSVLVSQRDALSALGLTASVTDSDPMAWLEETARAGRIAELRAVGGLGDFGWLLHATGPVRVSDLLPPLPAWRPNPASFPTTD